MARERYTYARADEGRAKDLVGQVLSTHQQMKSARGNFDTLWQKVSERVLPNYSDFIMQWAEGQRRTNLVFESTAVLALEHFCAALESMLCPATQQWHSLRPSDPKYWGDASIAQWCDQLTDVLFRIRYAPKANFQAQVHEVFAQIGAFGTGPMMVDDVVGYGMRYRCLHLAETLGLENSAGVIDNVQRKYQLTASAALDAENRGIFEKGSLPPMIREAATRQPTSKYWFVHAVYPDPEYSPRRVDGMPFKSVHIAQEMRCLLKESGYRTQPILMPRYRVNSKETYGRGPGVDVLPDILMLNEMAKTNIRGRQRAAAPPILLADDGTMAAFDMRSDALNYGTLSADGKALVQPLQLGANFESTVEFMNESRKLIERAFLVDIFSILADPNQQMTATEVLQRAQEKGQLLAPIIGRIQSELFGPLITRELDIADRAGLLPPPPQKLARDGRIDLEVVYESEIQVAQRKSKALAVAAVLQQASPLFNIDPTIAKKINPERTLAIIAEANGAPAGMLNTPDENAQAEEALQQQQQLTNLAQLAGPASQAIKNIADAQRASGSTTPGNLPQ
jgi:hypothetical protein